MLELEEDRFIAGFHQKVQKARDEDWHDRHIKHKIFQVGDLVLLYESKFLRQPHKFKAHWLGPFIIHKVTKVGVVQLVNLQGELYGGLVNGVQLKLYKDSSLPFVSEG